MIFTIIWLGGEVSLDENIDTSLIYDGLFI